MKFSKIFSFIGNQAMRIAEQPPCWDMYYDEMENPNKQPLTPKWLRNRLNK